MQYIVVVKDILCHYDFTVEKTGKSMKGDVKNAVVQMLSDDVPVKVSLVRQARICDVECGVVYDMLYYDDHGRLAAGVTSAGK